MNNIILAALIQKITRSGLRLARMLFTIGIGGVSCSGKTTVAKKIADIASNEYGFLCKILHQDDFFRPTCEIPQAQNGMKDWDCPEALRIDEFHHRIKELKSEMSGSGRKLLIIDGFMLFGDNDHFANINLFDHAYLLDIPLEVVIKRRAGRKYPVAEDDRVIEGEWWEDPPGYIEHVVYPNYLKYHAKYLHGHCSRVKVIETSSSDDFLSEKIARDILKTLDNTV